MGAAAYVRIVFVVALSACTSIGGAMGGGDDVEEEDIPPTDEETPPCMVNCEVDGLDSTVGCGGVYNPDQILDYHVTMKASDWTALKNDTTNDVYFPATFRCNEDAPLAFQIGIRRKRSEGTDKPGIKINFHEYQPDGSHFSLKKFSLENGSAEPKALMAEYMSWRLMVASKTLSSRAAFSRIFVNDQLIGLYVNVEQVDKRFLRSRGKDDEGWLFKVSGVGSDGYKTNEATPNPYQSRLCYWSPTNPCAVPAASVLETQVPMQLDLDQMLQFGGVNALVANSDGPIAKPNNFYFYDDPAGSPRVYFPWDLDTTHLGTNSVFFVRRATFTDVLFTHWKDEYVAGLQAMMAGPLTLAAINAELDRLAMVAGPAFDEDPSFSGGHAGAVSDLRAWWANRYPAVSAELAASQP